ncbi:MAG TPA: HEAT repeat domain-containing protein [Candidatus Ozemobacteraceae bacterium]|mgnify:CR=1 FL=1|nr:HEAT repeat domain-containing protein [Candidatus Ozemobacteraceae bacterium]
MTDRTDTPAVGFDDCLTLIESADPADRRRGTAQLERFHETRALRVALALANDPDEEVRETAREVAGTLRRAGVEITAGKPLRRVVATDTLLSSPEVMDETFFLWRRNRKDIVTAWALTDAPQILFGLGLFTMPAFGVRFHPGSEAFFWAAVLFTIIQLLMRPFAWMLMGRGFIGSFPDREAQTIAARRISGLEYLGFFQMQIIASGPLIAGFGFVIFVAGDIAPFAFILYLLFFLAYHSYTYTLMPRQLIENGDVFRSIRGLLNDGAEGYRFQRHVYMSFLWFMAVSYTAMLMSGSVLFETWLNRFRDAELLGVLILADALLDQFWIGWQITVARLLRNGGFRARVA